MTQQHHFKAFIRALAALAFLWPLCGSISVGHAAPTDFIYRDGIRLMLNGQQYKFAGVNADTWFGCWSNEVPTDAQLDRFFRELNPRSMTRIWVMPGSDLSIMDRIVAKADQYNQYVSPVLGNGNADCDSIGTKTSAWYASGFRTTYHSHIRTVVDRYKNSRAIGFWELINEPNGKDPNLKQFYSETSDLIRSIDPNHLIGSGAHAAWSSGSTAAYTDQHNLPNIDLISMHEYDDRTFQWANEARSAAQALGKPFYVGEDGFCCGGGPSGSWAQNAPILVAEFDKYLGYPECAGMTYWDFKLGHPGAGETINFGDGGWDVLRTYSHNYRGGASAASGSPSSSATPPVAPSGLSVTLAASSQASLGWSDNANDETDYKIERRTRMTGSYVQIGTGAANSVSYQDIGLAAETTYSYRVRAHNAGGDSGYSAEVGVTTASVVNTTINDNTIGTGQNEFEYLGSWGYWSGDSAKYQGDDHNSVSANDSANFRFTGTQVKYYGKRARHHGMVAVSIDGGSETNVDLYASASFDQVLLYTSPVLTPSSHTLKIRVTATKNASSSGMTITVDKVDVVQSSAAAVPAAPSNLTATPVSGSQTSLRWTDNANNETSFEIERKTGSTGTYVEVATTPANVTTYKDLGLADGTAYYYRVRASISTGSSSAYSNEVRAPSAATTPGVTVVNDNTLGTGKGQFQYTGKWNYWSGNSPKYQNDDHNTNTFGAVAILSFTGTQVRYYAKQAPHHGIASVSIDGGPVTNVDLYASTSADQVLVYTSPVLAAGNHMVRIRAAGAKNANSTDTTITVDKLDLVP